MSEARFGNYRVVSELGSGALSTIHKAVQEPLGRVVALKALKAQMASSSSFGEQLEREAKILRDLAHPNVVLLLDVGRTDTGRPFLVLEHVDGRSLQDVLEGHGKNKGLTGRTESARALRVESALAIAVSVCAALEHVHEKGVVHRDVKPSNILLGTSGIVKLIDFGIAHRESTASVSDAFGTEGVTPSGRMAPEAVKDAFGTPAYMSPEQILGDFVDGRSDLFSLGVVLYEMLSGHRPFETKAAAQRTRREQAPPLRDRAPSVPRTVERLVLRLLEKSPHERYSTAAVVLERLQHELRALTASDTPLLVRAALGTNERKTGAPPPLGTTRGMTARRAALGQAVILAGFVVGALAIEGTAVSGGADHGSRPLELAPEQAGGLRVLATPWALVRVDGQQVETTPFARPIPLAPGKHWVTLMHPEAPPVDREINVEPNEIITLDVTMQLRDAG